MVVCGVSQPLMVLKFFGSLEIRDGWDDSGDWELYYSFCRTTAIVANTLNRLCGKLRWLTLGGIIGCWLPNPYVNVGSLESESIVTICGSGEATEEVVIVSLAIAPDSSVQLRTAGVLFLIGLLSSDERSTEKCLILRMKNPKGGFGSSLLMNEDKEILGYLWAAKVNKVTSRSYDINESESECVSCWRLCRQTNRSNWKLIFYDI